MVGMEEDEVGLALPQGRGFQAATGAQPAIGMEDGPAVAQGLEQGASDDPLRAGRNLVDGNLRQQPGWHRPALLTASVLAAGHQPDEAGEGPPGLPILGGYLQDLHRRLQVGASGLQQDPR